MMLKNRGRKEYVAILENYIFLILKDHIKEMKLKRKKKEYKIERVNIPGKTLKGVESLFARSC